MALASKVTSAMSVANVHLAEVFLPWVPAVEVHLVL